MERNLFSHSSGGKVQDRGASQFSSCKDSLPGLQAATFSLCPHVAEKANSDLSFFSLVPPCSLWNLSSPTRDQTWALGNESGEYYLLAHQGTPWYLSFFFL